MTATQLEQRLLDYAVQCTFLCRELPIQQYFDAEHVAKQLTRAATHPGFHYPEARAAQSKRDFIHKISVLLKELRESQAELRYIQRMQYLPADRLSHIMRESAELVASFTATVNSAKSNHRPTGHSMR